MSRMLAALLHRRPRATPRLPVVRHGLDDVEFVRSPPAIFGDSLSEPTYEDGTPLPPEPRRDLRRPRDAASQR